MTQRFWQRWLMTTGGILAVFGVVMAVAGDSEFFHWVSGPLIDRAFWIQGVAAEARTFRAWVYGAWGGTTAGFGLLIAVVAKQALQQENQHFRHEVLAALTLWFLVDTGASLEFGVWGNASAINLPAYAALTVPLIFGAPLRRRG